MLFVHNTSRVKGEAYPNLLREKGLFAFPSLVFLDADGKLMVRLDYLDLMLSGDKFVKLLSNYIDLFQARADLRAKRAAIDRQLLVTELRLGMISLEEASMKVSAVRGASKEDQKKLASLLVDLEVRHLTANLRKLGANNVNTKLSAMAKAGRLPTDRLAPRFWNHVLRHAAKNKDVQLYEKGIADLRRRFKDQPGFTKTLKYHEKQLSTIRKKSPTPN